MRNAALLVVGLIVAVAIVACGEDDSGSGASGEGGGEATLATSSLDKAQFAKRADGICSAEREQLLARAQKYQEENPVGEEDPNVAQAEAIHAVVLPMLERELAQIRELGAPEGEEEQVEAILVAQEEAIETVAGLDEIEPVEDGYEKYFKAVAKQMQEYGIGQCAVL